MRITNQGEFVQHRTPMNRERVYVEGIREGELKSFRAWDTSRRCDQYLFVYVLCSANALVIRSLSRGNMSCSSFSISDSLYSSSA
jgi:hypothetical protein